MLLLHRMLNLLEQQKTKVWENKIKVIKIVKLVEGILGYFDAENIWGTC